LSLIPTLLVAAPQRVLESAREIPVVADVDVVVVGGGSGGVAAAAEAAKSGAKVFLAAPRMYLGEDLCGPYRIWIKPTEEPDTPLAKAMFADPLAKRGLTFTYTTSIPSVERHLDSDPPRMLNDGQFSSAYTQSVQYNGNVSITADLGETHKLNRIAAQFFQVPNNFDIQNIAVSASADGAAWEKVGDLANPDHLKGQYVEKPLELTMDVATTARYLKFDVTKGERAGRVLIGELQAFAARAETDDNTRMTNTSPMLVKSSLEEALIGAGVQFVYGSPTTDVLRDADGKLAGIVIANRAGRQAIRAKAIIDATGMGWFAQTAGAKVTFPPAGTQTFRRIVVGGTPRTGAGIASCTPIPIQTSIGGEGPAIYGSGGFGKMVQRVNAPMSTEHREVFDYTLKLAVPAPTFAAMAEAEQVARDLTFDPLQVEESETLLPTSPIAIDASGVAGLYYVAPTGPDPSILTTLRAGTELGTRVAKAVAKANVRASATVAGLPAASATRKDGVVGEPLDGFRPEVKAKQTVASPDRALPVFGEYDVVVVGGGTSGAPAGIGAARRGAKTLVIEYLHGLGGVGTTGMIGIYCAGYRKGFTEEIDKGIKDIGSPTYIVAKQEYWRREIRKAGGDIWFGALGCGAYRVGNKVAGVIVATPEGRGVVLAKVVIDGTGNADVAAAAGAETVYNSPRDVAMQGTGIPYRAPGASYINTDWTYVDEVDMVDVTTALIAAKRKFSGTYDLGQLIDTRERRRIVGDYTLTPLDIVNQRHFPDTVQISQGGKLDKHGPTVDPFYSINNHLGGLAYTPYRCLLPKGLDGILVVGIGLSAERDAIPSVRMQPGLQNLGYASGVAATMAAKADCPTRDIDLKALQKHLIANGSLTPDIADHTDSYPLPEAVVQSAVIQLRNRDYVKLGVIMAQAEASMPMLRRAYADAPTPEGKLRVAHVLGMMGDPTGVDALLKAVEESKDLGTENISHYFPNITWEDSYILALGRAGDARAVPVLLAKLSAIGRHEDFYWKHVRTIIQALERLGDARGAAPIAELLKSRGGSGFAVQEVEDGGRMRGRGDSLELIMARALYSLGDQDGLGEKNLREFANDVRGHYRRCALGILAQGPGYALRK
jgi:flavin-dependent dehydrogenase